MPCLLDPVAHTFIHTADNDPKVIRNNFSGLGIDLDSGDYPVIEIRVSRTGTAGRFDTFWGTTDANGFMGTRRVDDQTMLPSDGLFHIIQFDMSDESAWTSTLDDLRIDPFAGLGTNRSFEIDWVRIGTPIPEPSRALLLGFGGVAMLLRRRRK